MVNLNKFVGIPFEFNKSSYESASCAGLAALFYREHGWKPDDYPKPKTKEWYIEQPFLMERFLLRHFDKTRDFDELEYGSLLWFSINNEGHLGIYLGNDRFLTTYPKVNEFNGGISFIDRFKKYWLKQPGVKFIAAFNRRKTGDN